MRHSTLLVSGGTQNYWGDGSDGALNTSGNVTLSSTTDGDMVVKQYASLVINTGHTLTVANRCKGLVIYVHGDCTINGTLSMTGKGASTSAAAAGDSAGTAGLKFPRFTAAGTDTYATASATALANTGSALINTEANQRRINGNGTVYTIARYGGTVANTNHVDGTDSGGSGGGGGSWSAVGGNGGRGTCFSGGSGGGGGGTIPALAAGGIGSEDGGAGGIGNAGGAGGTGNPGGTTNDGGNVGATGTGGTLVLIVKGVLAIGATGVVETKGVDGVFNSGNGGGAGASGGGAMLIFYAEGLVNNGTITAAGGAGGGKTAGSATNGISGGAGAVRTFQIKK